MQSAACRPHAFTLLLPVMPPLRAALRAHAHAHGTAQCTHHG